MACSSSRVALLGPGDVLNETYRVVSSAQAAPTGTAYRAVNMHTNGPASLYVPHPERNLDAAALERLRRAARPVIHPAVARNYGMFHTRDYGGLHFMAVEHVPGPSLAQAVAERGPVPEDVLKTLALRALEGLEAAHAQGATCGALCPNSLILRDGRAERPVLAPPIEAIVRAALETEERRDLRDDLYALGSTLALAASGRVFDEDAAFDKTRAVAALSEDVAAAPESLRPLLTALTHADPRRRPQSAAAAAEMLRVAVRPPVRLRALARRVRVGWGAAAALIAGAVFLQPLQTAMTAQSSAALMERDADLEARAHDPAPSAPIAPRMLAAHDQATPAQGAPQPHSGVQTMGAALSFGRPSAEFLASAPAFEIISDSGAPLLRVSETTAAAEREAFETAPRMERAPAMESAPVMERAPADESSGADGESPARPAPPERAESGWGDAATTIFIDEYDVDLLVEVHKNCGALSADPPRNPHQGYDANRPLRLTGAVARESDLDSLIDSLSALDGAPDVNVDDVMVLNPSVCVIRALTPPPTDSGVEIVFLSGHPDPERMGQEITSDYIARDEVLVIEIHLPADMTGYLTAMLTSDNGSSLLLLPHLMRRANDVQTIGVVEDGRRRIALSYLLSEANNRDKFALQLDGVSYGAGLVTAVVSEEPLIAPKELHANNAHYENWLKDGYDELWYNDIAVHAAQRLTLDAGE